MPKRVNMKEVKTKTDSDEPVVAEQTCRDCKKKFPEDKFVASWHRCESCYDKTIDALIKKVATATVKDDPVEDENDL